jgi:hypothetical protein
MMSRRARQRGYPFECFDKKHNPAQDVITWDGFFLGLLLVCQVQMFGLAVFGPQCSLWLSFMSQRVHERAKLGVHGAFHKINVLQANLICENTAVLLLVCYVRMVHTVVENPTGSYIFKYDSMKFIIEVLGLDLVHTWMKMFSHWSPKPTHLVGTLINIQSLKRVYSRKIWSARFKRLSNNIKLLNLNFGRKSALQLRRKRMRTRKVSFTTSKKRDGMGSWVIGGKDLKASGEYTAPFCDAVLNVWETHRFELCEPVFLLGDMLEACPFPMKQQRELKITKKSAGPVFGETCSSKKAVIDIVVDPTSRPSICTCWPESDNELRCRACKALPKTAGPHLDSLNADLRNPVGPHPDSLSADLSAIGEECSTPDHGTDHGTKPESDFGTVYETKPETKPENNFGTDYETKKPRTLPLARAWISEFASTCFMDD